MSVKSVVLIGIVAAAFAAGSVQATESVVAPKAMMAVQVATQQVATQEVAARQKHRHRNRCEKSGKGCAPS